MRIAIVGGSGFIGTRLAERLSKAGHHLAIIDKVDSKAFPLFTRKADVRDYESLLASLEGSEVIINLAAEHRDDVSPRSLYDEVNVGGARNICKAADSLGIKRMVFTSSVAVYGFAKPDTDENGIFAPFNDYGRTKMEAEKVYREWLAVDGTRSLTILRPTVVFGERNRGNVYNLLKLMASGLFLMIGSGENVKSMAYVENVAAFLENALTFPEGEKVFNYIDKPDFDMNTLVKFVRGMIGKKAVIRLRMPYWIGYLGGKCFDALAIVLRKKLPISSIRIRKFCATTQFSSSKLDSIGFKPPITLSEGLARTIRFEFLENNYRNDSRVYFSE
jgi:nucleoside-diphosphate-sugar epimerase